MILTIHMACYKCRLLSHLLTYCASGPTKVGWLWRVDGKNCNKEGHSAA